jgi:hypothetical protein
MDRTDALVALALVAAGIVAPGILDYLLHRAGYPTFGKLTWILGMGILVGGAWLVWLRGVELTGPIE